MVAAVRRGQSLRAVARRFGVGVATVTLWVERARGQRLDRVDWSDRSSVPHRTQRIDSSTEDLILTVRKELAHGDLGAVGAQAIQQALLDRGDTAAPSLRTINRILARRGALDGRVRTRRPAPPRGWYLPEVAAARAELDSFDIVEGLVIKEGPEVEVLNGVSLHGGLVVSWPTTAPVTAVLTVESLTEHWREVGLPGYAQFDNDMIFQGTHRYPDALGRVIRLCLSLGVAPVFVPPREVGFQAMIESYNGWWQARVWARFQHPDLERPARPFAEACAGPASAAGGPDRGGPRPPPLPGGLASEPEDPASGAAGLPATDQRCGRGDPAGTDLGGECGVAQPAGPLRGGPGGGQDPVLHPATEGTEDSAAGPGGGLPAAQPRVPGLNEAVRDVLAPVTVRAIRCSGRCGTYPVTS